MTNAEARFNKSLRPRKPEGSLGRTAQDVHLDSHTAPNYDYSCVACLVLFIASRPRKLKGCLGEGVSNRRTFSSASEPDPVRFDRNKLMFIQLFRFYK